MGRTLVTGLILVIVFLMGVLFGVEKNEIGKPPDVEPNIIEQDPPPTETQQVSNPSEANQSEVDMPSNNMQLVDRDLATNEQYLTHKTAQFLESGVKGFYNVIIEIMYGFSKVFF